MSINRNKKNTIKVSVSDFSEEEISLYTSSSEVKQNYKNPSNSTIKTIPKIIISESEESDSEETSLKIKPENLTYTKDKLGEGAYGIVYPGVLKINGFEHKVAVKHITLTVLNISSAQKEIEIMTYLTTKCKHPNLLPLYGHYDTTEGYILVSPLAEQGTLAKNIEKLNDKQQWSSTLGLIEAVVHLANNKIVHSDIKPANLLIELINGNWNIKLCDFGLSFNLNVSAPKKYNGTVAFNAPEVLKKEAYNSYSSDIYSTGRTIFCIFAKTKNPLYPITDKQILKERTINNEMPPIPQGFPENIKKIIEWSWKPKPQDRPTADQVMSVLKGVKCH